MRPPFSDLVNLEPVDPTEAMGKTVGEVKELDFDSNDIASALRGIASVIEPYQRQRDMLKSEKEKQQMTIVQMANENTKIRAALDKVEEAMNRLQRMIEEEPDLKTKKKLRKTKKMFEKSLNDLQ